MKPHVFIVLVQPMDSIGGDSKQSKKEIEAKTSSVKKRFSGGSTFFKADFVTDISLLTLYHHSVLDSCKILYS